jgi:hypothetical protein
VGYRAATDLILVNDLDAMKSGRDVVSHRFSPRFSLEASLYRKRAWRCGRTSLHLFVAFAANGALSACGGLTRFPVADAVVIDADQTPFAPAPAEYVSPFVWDGADQLAFRPIARFFAVDPAWRARNVNALDEVPDSSWFENRIGKSTLSADELRSGPCGSKVLDPSAPDGAWLIDQGKPNGANPGFRVNIPGIGKFMLKADPDGEPERATGATAIAARIYYASGYNAPCDSVVYFRPEVLALKPGLVVTDNSGVPRPFDRAALRRVLSAASRRNGKVRMVASRWLPGKPVGPYRYEGTREDDPNDVIPHEDRRELRGARLLAAWLNHFDSREQNTMDVFVPADTNEEGVGGKGHVRHFILDLGDCFGSVWAADGISRRLGHAYYFDFGYVAEDFLTFGILQRPWDRAKRDGGIFNYFSSRDFDAEAWRGGYGNPAFMRMTEEDGAWMARIIARFDDSLVAAAVAAADYDGPSTDYLSRTLQERRDILLRRYLRKLSPLADVAVRGTSLCATDLARRTGVSSVSPNAYSESAVFFEEVKLSPRERLMPRAGRDASVCVELPRTTGSASGRDSDSRYAVLDLFTSSSENPLRVHLYDGGDRGYRVLGIERPSSAARP